MGVREFSEFELDRPVSAPGRTAIIHLETVMGAAVRCLGISRDLIRSDNRHPRVVLARHVVVYLSRTLAKPRPSYPELARAIKHRDHTTAIHAERKINQRLTANDADTMLAIHEVCRTIASDTGMSFEEVIGPVDKRILK